jgi:hypothetical protein
MGRVQTLRDTFEPHDTRLIAGGIPAGHADTGSTPKKGLLRR